MRAARASSSVTDATHKVPLLLQPSSRRGCGGDLRSTHNAVPFNNAEQKWNVDAFGGTRFWIVHRGRSVIGLTWVVGQFLNKRQLDHCDWPRIRGSGNGVHCCTLRVLLCIVVVVGGVFSTALYTPQLRGSALRCELSQTLAPQDWRPTSGQTRFCWWSIRTQTQQTGLLSGSPKTAPRRRNRCGSKRDENVWHRRWLLVGFVGGSHRSDAGGFSILLYDISKRCDRRARFRRVLKTVLKQNCSNSIGRPFSFDFLSCVHLRAVRLD